VIDRPEVGYGSWPSPITIEMAVSSSLSLREARLDGDDVYWTEGRPAEGGRQVIVRWNEAEGTSDVTPAPFDARTMAHEYGGGWYAVAEGTVYFVNLTDGRIYRQARGGAPEPLTEEGPYRHGDLAVDRARGRLLCVREDMSPLAESGHGDGATSNGGRGPEPRDLLIAVELASGAVQLLASGYDFYSTPRPSPDGRLLSWLAWRHPNMPWDTNELWLAAVAEDGSLSDERMIAGGGEESIVQPEWAPDGSLVFASDRTGWWNLYRATAPSEPGGGEILPLTSMEAEFAGPQWVFGMRWFGIADDGTIVAAADRHGLDELWMIPATGQPEKVDVPDEVIDSLVVGNGRVVYLGASSAKPRAVVLLDLKGGERRELRASFELAVDPAYLSRPEEITFPTTEGEVAYALYYPPANPDVTRPPDERPPLVVMSHGGPTSQTTRALDMSKQVFTSRGFGVVDVNYRGSSGYGRAYMRRLDGKWGIFDVDDCIAAARYLATRGQIDEQRMAIRGGSAGGYTTLCALVFHDGVFGAGASYFGVGDMEGLARDTHKFESRYADRLVAPYPERIDIYRERSPIHFMHRISRPLIVLQGEDDKVVPMVQAEELVASLRERHIPNAYLLFAGEGHGFRKAQNIRRSLEAELSFYAQVFGFRLSDGFEPVKVEFLGA
jgi:dipeptidyl aminopeptidase/acylaminoacyl peptidase